MVISTQMKTTKLINGQIEPVEVSFTASTMDENLWEVRRQWIAQALRQTGGNKLQAAKILGVNRNTLASMLKKLDIDYREFKPQ